MEEKCQMVINVSTWKRLISHKKGPKITFDDVINRILDFYENGDDE